MRCANVVSAPPRGGSLWLIFHRFTSIGRSRVRDRRSPFLPPHPPLKKVTRWSQTCQPIQPIPLLLSEVGVSSFLEEGRVIRRNRREMRWLGWQRLMPSIVGGSLGRSPISWRRIIRSSYGPVPSRAAISSRARLSSQPEASFLIRASRASSISRGFPTSSSLCGNGTANTQLIPPLIRDCWLGVAIRAPSTQ